MISNVGNFVKIYNEPMPLYRSCLSYASYILLDFYGIFGYNTEFTTAVMAGVYG